MVTMARQGARIYLRRSDGKQEESLEQQLEWAIGRARQLGVTLDASAADLGHMRAH